ncbi:MAG TPA: hypothetical protein VHL57_12245 [Flavobacteriales bacterium]|jgi:hypothetical protein|nr:hypothetical protein [Flavobacteriales bacterium]
MKHLLTAVLATGLLFQACQNDPTQSEQYKHLEDEKALVSSESSMKDSTINDMFGAFNRVSENLRAIREKQGLLSKSGGVEGGKNMEETMAADLHAIDSLLSENKKIIAKLRKTSSSQGKKLSELEKSIIELERTVGEKDTEIGSLKEQLTSTNASLASMIQMYQDKDQLAMAQKGELNTAYYCVGTAKELKDNGVVTKEGGFVGLGKSTKLNTQTMNLTYFKKIDITQTTVIPVNTKKAKLITSHPTGSYKLNGEGKVDNLTVTDTAAFWSVSKYLVIQAD